MTSVDVVSVERYLLGVSRLSHVSVISIGTGFQWKLLALKILQKKPVKHLCSRFKKESFSMEKYSLLNFVNGVYVFV